MCARLGRGTTSIRPGVEGTDGLQQPELRPKREGQGEAGEFNRSRPGFKNGKFPKKPLDAPSVPSSAAAATPIPTGSPGPTATVWPIETRLAPTAIPQAPTLTATGVNRVTPVPTSSTQPTAQGPQSRMVVIRARSSLEVKQLREMHLDIVRVRRHLLR